ncbi:MAG: hypothetical protein ACPL4H_08505 [Anaerolineales bacterium]
MQLINPILLLISVISPLLAFIAAMILRQFKFRMALIWTAAFGGIAISWLAIVGLRFSLPTYALLVTWQPRQLFLDSPALLIDGYNWGLALALLSLALAFLFTEPSLSEGVSFTSLVSGLLVIVLALFAVLAGNQLTLLLAWAAIDLVELFIWLSRSIHPELRERIILAFASRASGLILSTYGIGQVGVYLLASVLRLGVFPFHIPYVENTEIRRGFGSILRLVPPLVTIPFLVRLASFGQNDSLNFLVPIVVIVALSAAILWISAENEIEGRPFWIITISAFILISTLKNQPTATLAWGIILVGLGGSIFLSKVRNRYWIFWTILQILILCGIPFSPLWDINRIYQLPLNIWSGLILLTHILLMGGFWRHTNRKISESLIGERWITALYGIGLTILALLPFIVGYAGWKNLLESGTSYIYPSTRSPISFWIGIAITFLFIIGYFVKPKINISFPNHAQNVLKLLSFDWVIEFLRWSFRKLSDLFYFINLVFEGQGGILWAFLALILLGGFLYIVTGGG